MNIHDSAGTGSLRNDDLRHPGGFDEQCDAVRIFLTNANRNANRDAAWDQARREARRLAQGGAQA